MENYKKKYEQAMLRMNKWVEGSEITDPKEVAEFVFPELRESDDERIRKEIVEYIKIQQRVIKDEGHIQQANDIEKWIVWLERQGKPIDKIVKRAMNEKQRVLLTETNGDANIDWDTRSLQDVKLLLEYGLDYINKLEKQGEQKQDANYPKFNYDDVLALQCCMGTVKKIQEDKELYEQLQSLHDRIHDAYWLEKQYEQKPTDKVESKFNIGDWIHHEISGNTFHINKIENGLYVSDEGATISLGRQNDWRLWTIQDAKDGDVLQLGKVTAIFKELIDNNNCKCHCSACKGRFEISSQEEDDNSYGCYDAIPATKEQKDLLFQKMKEEGYRWDAEKKELKKIEQKPAWSEEDERILQTLINDTEKNIFVIKKEERPDIMSGLSEIYIEILRWLKSLKERMKGE